MPIPTTLFLDIGGVLGTNGWDGDARRRAADAFQLDRGEMEGRHRLAFGAYEEGRLTLDEYLHHVVFHRARSFSADSFREFMVAQSRPFPDVIALVRGIKARHPLRIATISNEGRELAAHRTQLFDLASFIDVFVFSCFVGLRKPDPAIYRLALDLVQARPEEVVYIEDRDLFVEVAAGMGLRAIQHASCESTARALAKCGLAATPEPGP